MQWGERAGRRAERTSHTLDLTPVEVKGGAYQSSFSKRMRLASAMNLMSAMDKGLPQVKITVREGFNLSSRAWRDRCWGSTGLTVFSKAALAFEVSSPLATASFNICSSFKGISKM